MTSAELAVIVQNFRRNSQECNNAHYAKSTEAWSQAMMLAEIAYQLAVANERAAPPGEPGAAYFEYSPSGLPVRKPL